MPHSLYRLIPFASIPFNIYSEQDALLLPLIFLILLWELLCVSLLPNLTIVYMSIR